MLNLLYITTYQQVTNSWLTVSQTANRPPTNGWLMADSWPTNSQQIAERRLTVFFWELFFTNSRKTVDSFLGGAVLHNISYLVTNNNCTSLPSLILPWFVNKILAPWREQIEKLVKNNMTLLNIHKQNKFPLSDVKKYKSVALRFQIRSRNAGFYKWRVEYHSTRRNP